MSEALPGAACVLGAYLLGSVSFGLIWAARTGVDLRSAGSGNIGATNVGRVLGRPAGIVVAILDALKGVAAVLVARAVFGASSPWTAGAGLAAATGHVFPIWHGLRGGKAAATSIGALVAAVPAAGLSAAATFAVLRVTTKRASIGSLAGSLVGVGVVAWLAPDARLAMAVALLVLVVVRHAGNLGRLMRGEEPPS